MVAPKKLLEDTIAGNAQAVAEAIEGIRDSQYAPTYYNDEQALRSVICFAYISCIDEFLRIDELPSGKGYADVVYLPRRNVDKPVLVVELKWNKSARGAIAQIKDRQYAAWIADYTGDILLVGISYDKKSKEHACLIETWRKT